MQVLIFCHHQRNMIRRPLRECLKATGITYRVELASITVYDQEHEKYSIFVVINSVASISQHISFCSPANLLQHLVCAAREPEIEQTYICTGQNAVNSCQNGKFEVPLDGIIRMVLAVSCQNKPDSVLGKIHKNRLAVFAARWYGGAFLLQKRIYL